MQSVCATARSLRVSPAVRNSTSPSKTTSFTEQRGAIDDWSAQMFFANMEFAHDLLNGDASSFGGMGSGDFQVRGRLDMLEQMAKMLNLVSAYLG
ncbi:MAG: hypothetical protein L6V85_02035 [Clostridiales bacterium]|nr:MAG: hypothetical protein L6V85_02035 [Clostridiales bacterium]